MKKPLRLIALLLAFISLIASAGAAAPDGKVYELRTYTAMPGKIENVSWRLRGHTTRIFDRFGMVSVAYWIPRDAADGAGEKIVYLLEHKSREAADAAWKAFQADPEWK